MDTVPYGWLLLCILVFLLAQLHTRRGKCKSLTVAYTSTICYSKADTKSLSTAAARTDHFSYMFALLLILSASLAGAFLLFVYSCYGQLLLDLLLHCSKQVVGLVAHMPEPPSVNQIDPNFHSPVIHYLITIELCQAKDCITLVRKGRSLEV